MYETIASAIESRFFMQHLIFMQYTSHYQNMCLNESVKRNYPKNFFRNYFQREFIFSPGESSKTIASVGANPPPPR